MDQRILLIEDNPDITRVVQYELEQAGYKVLTAPDGVTGLTSARENSPELVILDLGLPDFDGAEIADGHFSRDDRVEFWEDFHLNRVRLKLLDDFPTF